MKEIIREDILLTGIQIDDESYNKIRHFANRHHKVYCDHMTMSFGSRIPEDVHKYLCEHDGEEVTLYATSIGRSNDAVALRIITPAPSVNNIKHITVSARKRPFDSNFIEEWHQLAEAIVLHGVVRVWFNEGTPIV